MIIDCDSCTVRGKACSECVVSVVLGAPPEGIELDDTERRALAALAAGGMVPELRLTGTGPEQAPGARAAGARAPGTSPGSSQGRASGGGSLPRAGRPTPEASSAGTRAGRRAVG